MRYVHQFGAHDHIRDVFRDVFVVSFHYESFPSHEKLPYKLSNGEAIFTYSIIQN